MFQFSSKFVASMVIAGLSISSAQAQTYARLGDYQPAPVAQPAPSVQPTVQPGGCTVTFRGREPIYNNCTQSQIDSLRGGAGADPALAQRGQVMAQDRHNRTELIGQDLLSYAGYRVIDRVLPPRYSGYGYTYGGYGSYGDPYQGGYNNGYRRVDPQCDPRYRSC